MSIPALNWALRNPRVQREVFDVDRSVLIVLADHANAEHEVWISIGTIVAESGFQHATVERALKWLADHGFAENVGYRQRSRLRRLHVDDVPQREGGQVTNGKADLPRTSLARPSDVPHTSPGVRDEPEPKPDPQLTAAAVQMNLSPCASAAGAATSAGGEGQEAPFARASARARTHTREGEREATSSTTTNEDEERQRLAALGGAGEKEKRTNVVAIRREPRPLSRLDLPTAPLDRLVALIDENGPLAADAADVIARRGLTLDDARTRCGRPPPAHHARPAGAHDGQHADDQPERPDTSTPRARTQ